MERLDNYEIIEIEENECDFLIPKRKSEKNLPLELKQFILDKIKENSITGRIIKIAKYDIFLIYLDNKILFFNYSNLQILTTNENYKDLEMKDFCIFRIS